MYIILDQILDGLPCVISFSIPTFPFDEILSLSSFNSLIENLLDDVVFLSQLALSICKLINVLVDRKIEREREKYLNE